MTKWTTPESPEERRKKAEEALSQPLGLLRELQELLRADLMSKQAEHELLCRQLEVVKAGNGKP
jgi:hypothetical protein